jgi:hypothetical protein
VLTSRWRSYFPSSYAGWVGCAGNRYEYCTMLTPSSSNLGHSQAGVSQPAAGQTMNQLIEPTAYPTIQ